MTEAQLARLAHGSTGAPITVAVLPHPFGTVGRSGLVGIASDTLRDHADLFAGFDSREKAR